MVILLARSDEDDKALDNLWQRYSAPLFILEFGSQSLILLLHMPCICSMPSYLSVINVLKKDLFSHQHHCATMVS